MNLSNKATVCIPYNEFEALKKRLLALENAQKKSYGTAIRREGSIDRVFDILEATLKTELTPETQLLVTGAMRELCLYIGSTLEKEYPEFAKALPIGRNSPSLPDPAGSQMVNFDDL